MVKLTRCKTKYSKLIDEKSRIEKRTILYFEVNRTNSWLKKVFGAEKFSTDQKIMGHDLGHIHKAIMKTPNKSTQIKDWIISLIFTLLGMWVNSFSLSLDF